MKVLKPTNLEPIKDIIERVRLIKKPSSKDNDCQQLECRFCDQDWITQLEIYELWLDIDNDYSRMCLYRMLDRDYWELLQELVKRGVEKAADLSSRIMEYSIKHIRTQIVAFFVAEYAPIEIVRKYKKLLSYSLEEAYDSLALRIGGDEDFDIDKDRLYNRLEYFDICAKHNLHTTDEEAIEDLKIYLKNHGNNLWCDTVNEDRKIRELDFSLKLNHAINSWRKAIDMLGLTRAAIAFDQWDADLHNRINGIYEADCMYRRFPEINHDRLQYYWGIFIEMALNDLNYSESDSYFKDEWVSKRPEISNLMAQLNLEIAKPLQL